MDLPICVMHRPELIERVFIGIIGMRDERIVEHIESSRLQEQFKITLRETY